MSRLLCLLYNVRLTLFFAQGFYCVVAPPVLYLLCATIIAISKRNVFLQSSIWVVVRKPFERVKAVHDQTRLADKR